MEVNLTKQCNHLQYITVITSRIFGI